MNDNTDIVCIGGATIDVFILLNKLQKFSYDKFSNQISFPLGEKVDLDEYKLTVGGNACNISVGLSRLGFQTLLVAEIGKDEFSDKIINTLRNERVNYGLVKRTTRSNPYFNIILSYEGERTILSEKTPSEHDLDSGELNPKLIYLTSLKGNWAKLYEEALSKNPHSKLALNPGGSQIENDLSKLLSFFPKIDVLFVNISEAQKITKDNSPDVKQILKKLKSWGVQIAVVTDGRNGSYGIDQGGDVFQMGVVNSHKPFERTGAGDAYASGFLYAYLNGFGIKECLRYGAINADFVIRKIGAQEGLLTKKEIDQKAKENLSLTAVKI